MRIRRKYKLPIIIGAVSLVILAVTVTLSAVTVRRCRAEIKVISEERDMILAEMNSYILARDEALLAEASAKALVEDSEAAKRTAESERDIANARAERAEAAERDAVAKASASEVVLANTEAERDAVKKELSDLKDTISLVTEDMLIISNDAVTVSSVTFTKSGLYENGVNLSFVITPNSDEAYIDYSNAVIYVGVSDGTVDEYEVVRWSEAIREAAKKSPYIKGSITVGEFVLGHRCSDVNYVKIDAIKVYRNESACGDGSGFVFSANVYEKAELLPGEYVEKIEDIPDELLNAMAEFSEGKYRDYVMNVFNNPASIKDVNCLGAFFIRGNESRFADLRIAESGSHVYFVYEITAENRAGKQFSYIYWTLFYDIKKKDGVVSCNYDAVKTATDFSVAVVQDSLHYKGYKSLDAFWADVTGGRIKSFTRVK